MLCFTFLQLQLWNHYNILDHEFDLYCKIVLILLPILCISMITELKYLAPLSTIANICMACGLALTLYFAFQDVPSITEREYVGTLSQLPLFFGTAIFAFEGIALVSFFHCTLLSKQLLETQKKLIFLSTLITNRSCP